MKITIDVTEEDIALGERGECARCPVSLAVCRAIGVDPSLGLVEAGDDKIRYDCFGSRWSVPTPAEVVEFIVAFDTGGETHPFAFDIEPGDSFLVSPG